MNSPNTTAQVAAQSRCITGMGSPHHGSSLPFLRLRQRQLPFARTLGRSLALRLQPPAEVLHPHPMLDGGLLD